jgi:hypothetical protein
VKRQLWSFCIDNYTLRLSLMITDRNGKTLFRNNGVFNGLFIYTRTVGFLRWERQSLTRTCHPNRVRPWLYKHPMVVFLLIQLHVESTPLISAERAYQVWSNRKGQSRPSGQINSNKVKDLPRVSDGLSINTTTKEIKMTKSDRREQAIRREQIVNIKHGLTVPIKSKERKCSR